MFTNIAKAKFYNEMQAINEQKDLSKVATFMNQGENGNFSTDNLGVNSDFLGASLEGKVDTIKSFTDTLKAEIIFARSQFGNGLMIDTDKIWRDNMYDCKSTFENDTDIARISKDLCYISKKAAGKEEKYLYDKASDISFKIEDNRLGSHTVHSLEYAKWMLDGESMGGIGVIDDDAEAREYSDSTKCYEPNLNNFSFKTEIVYYSSDLKTTKTTPIKEYLANKKPNTITVEGATYTFADYGPSKKLMGNIKTTANGLEAYWVWIPRFAYKILGKNQVDIQFVTLDNKLMNLGENGSDTLPEGYVVHPTFAENNLKGIWFSKYKPSPIESIQIDTSDVTPNLSNFRSDETKLIYYTADGKSSIEVDYSENPSQTKEEGGKTYYFYKYDSKIWANVKTTANGLDAYWVWIPRFAYKLESGTSNVILIDENNKPIDTQTYGNELPQGYIVHEAFTQDTNIKGMWFSKYKPSAKDIKTDIGENAQKPDLSNFNSSKTKLIYYTADGKSSIEVDFSTNPNQTVERDGKTYYFYKYDSKIWANIKCENEGAVSYWTWIPRFAYKFESGTANVILIDENNKPLNTEVYGNSLPNGYTVHDAFKQDGNLKGLWFSKFKPSKLEQ